MIIRHDHFGRKKQLLHVMNFVEVTSQVCILTMMNLRNLANETPAIATVKSNAI